MIERAYTENVHAMCQYMQPMLWLYIKSNVHAESVTCANEKQCLINMSDVSLFSTSFIAEM